MATYESGVKKINANVHSVYRVLSDMNNVKMLLNAVQNPEVQARFNESIPEDKKDEFEKAKSQMSDIVNDITCTTDTVSLHTKFGEIGIRVADRELDKVVKLSNEKCPINFDFWAQVKEISPYETAVKLTLKADIPMMVRMMFSSKLDKLNEGIDKAASILTRLPFAAICQRMDAEGRTDGPMLNA